MNGQLIYQAPYGYVYVKPKIQFRYHTFQDSAIKTCVMTGGVSIWDVVQCCKDYNLILVSID